ncbi:MAG: phage protein, partial [Shewanella oncorhynchi]
MLFNRVASLVIGKSGGTGRELSGLRISFSIQKGSTKTPNKCTAKIWNMNPDTRSLVEVIGNVIILKAGYAEDLGLVNIFNGEVSRALTVREGSDWITEIEMQDGLSEFRDTKTSISFDKGVTAIQVVKSISSKFDLPVRELPDGFAQKQYKDGFAFVGKTRDAMDKACLYLGLEWSIQNGEIQVIKKGGFFKQKAVVLSSESGMLGSPSRESKTMTEKAASKEGITKSQKGVSVVDEIDDKGNSEKKLQVNGFKVKSLLQPTLQPGGYVQLKSRGIDEFLKIEDLVHEGD